MVLEKEPRNNLEYRAEDLEKVEVDLLLEGIYRYYGYDFRDYSYASIRRRIWNRIHMEQLTSITSLQEKVLHDPLVMKKLVRDFSINVTEMFRDPQFFLSFRENVVPLLRTYPFIRIWHAGCATGEEVYSMAILLYEEGLYEKTRIYATDMNEEVIKRAKMGVAPLDRMQEYTQNYLHAGGKQTFSKYYSASNGMVKFHPFLTKNIIFSRHNLVTDGSFNEFNIILCRNVMIYFNKGLQNHVHDLFYNSLSMFGMLALGNKESITFTKNAQYYAELDKTEKIYRKVK